MSFAALLISLTSNQGLAHHGCNTPGALWGQNVSLLRLDTENKVFGTHNALTFVPSFSYAPFESFSAGIRLPFSQMTINNTGTTQSGLGDLELSLQGTAFSIGQTFTMLVGTELRNTHWRHGRWHQWWALCSHPSYNAGLAPLRSMDFIEHVSVYLRPRRRRGSLP